MKQKKYCNKLNKCFKWYTHTHTHNFKKNKEVVIILQGWATLSLSRRSLVHVGGGLPKEESQGSRHTGATWETGRGDLPFSSSQILLP